MSVTINGTTGVSLVQNGVLTDANMPAGSVLQVAEGSTYIDVTTTGVETDTGLSATITPTSSSSKIVVISCLEGLRKQGGSGDSRLNIYLYRGGTVLSTYLANMWIYSNSTAFRHGGFAINYVDFPNTTSSLTYKLRFSGSDGSNWSVQADSNSGYSTIILMEIAG